MANNFDNLKPLNIPSLDLSRTIDIASAVQTQFDENHRENMRIAEEAYNNRQRMQQAMEETAANTAASNVQLEKIVAQQSRHIDLLEEQLSTQKEQLAILRNIFASSEDGVAVEKEIMKLIEEQIDDSHPLWEYVKDKGGDIAVAGVLEWGPVIWKAFKAYLAIKGIALP